MNEDTREKAAIAMRETGRRIALARHEAGLSDVTLASLMAIPPSQLADIQAGKRMPSPDEMLCLTSILGHDLDYFTDPYRLVGEGRFTFKMDGQASQPDPATDEKHKLLSLLGKCEAILMRLQPDSCPEWREGIGDCHKPTCDFCNAQSILDDIADLGMAGTPDPEDLATTGEAMRCAILSGEDHCQACGAKWTRHGEHCKGMDEKEA